MAQDAEADQGTEQGGVTHGQENAADEFAEAGEHVVAFGVPHERPEEAHRRGLPEGLDETAERRVGELGLDDLDRSIVDHIHREIESDQDPQPVVQPIATMASPVEERPDRGDPDRHHQLAKDLHVVVGCIPAAIGANRDHRLKHMSADPRYECIPEAIGGQCLHGEREDVEDKVRADESEEDLLGRSPRSAWFARIRTLALHRRYEDACLGVPGRLKDS